MIGMPHMRPLLTGGGIYLLSGVGAVSVWRATNTSPGGSDLLLWLLGLPTVLLAVAWVLQRWWNARAPSAQQDPVAEPTSRAEANDVPASPRGAGALAILASAMWLPAGREANEIVDALRRGQRPALHPTLRDLQGFPAAVAHLEDADEADADWALDADSRADVLHRRALALLRPVAEELLLTALPASAVDRHGDAAVPGAIASMHPYAMHHSQSARAPAVQQQATLRIVLLAPTHWPGTVRSAASNALGELAISLGHDPTALETLVHPLHSETDVWHVLSHVSSTLTHSPVEGDRALVLAADSWVAESMVEQLHAEDRLLRSGTSEGEVPGEGAAGLLLAAAHAGITDASVNLANAPTKAFANSDAGTLRLHLPRQARLAEATRARDAVRITSELIGRVLESAGCAADAPLQVVTGADHRPSRMVEAATALVAQRPELDPVADVLHLGVACGSMGVAGPLALLAVAAAHARDSETPTLALALSDATSRAAAVLAPATPAPLSPAAAPAA